MSIFGRRAALARLLIGGVMLAAIAGTSACASDSGALDSSVAVAGNQTMPEWAQENGPTMSTLGNGISAFTQAAAARDVPALSSSCAAFQVDVRNAQAGALPVPDSQIDGLLRNALELYSKAAASCVEGADNLDAAALQSAAGYLSEAGPYIDQVTGLLGNY